MHKKIYGFALGALMTAMFVSCNEGINNPDNGDKIITLQLAKNPEIVAWSGSHALTSYSTRADEDGSHVYDFPSDIEEKLQFKIPGDVTIINESRKNAPKDGIYVVLPGNYDYISLGDNNNNLKIDIYLEKGAKVDGLGSNFSIDNLNIYVSEGAELSLPNLPKNSYIYNNGIVKFPNGIQNTELKKVYNSNILEIGGNLNGGVELYSYGGNINFTTNNEVHIMGTIVSNNIVSSKGNLKFQPSSQDRVDICELQCYENDNYFDIDINGENTTFGKVTCKNFKAWGHFTTLSQEGLIKATEQISIGDIDFPVRTTTGSRGLLECKTLHFQNKNYSQILYDELYINAESYPDISNLSEELKLRINNSTITISPKCGNFEPEEKCPWCDHPESECDEDGCGHPECQCPPCKKSDPEPEPPFIPHPVSEVEVNLAINDQHTAQGINDLVSKLSIHVRYPGDVQIFIPIEQKWYCSQDDLYILNNHQEGNFIHGGPETISYNVGGYNVSLTFKYNDNGIYVTTGGINSQVFDHCVRNFGDGINFEVYMYMNDQANLTMDWFKRVLNGSTIKFIDKDEYNVGYPNYYINAFTDHGQGHGWDQDCAVNIIVEQENGFDRGVSGAHLNDSPYNWIYTSQSFLSSFPEDKDWDERVGSHGYHKHTFLWGEDED